MDDVRLPRVAVVGRYYNKQGGVSNVMAQLAERAARSGRYDVTVLSHEFVDWTDVDHLHRTRIAMLAKPFVAQVPSFRIGAKRTVDRGDYDLVHVHDPQLSCADIFTAHSSYSWYLGERRRESSAAKRAVSRVHPRHVVGPFMERSAYRSPMAEIVAVSGSVAGQIGSLFPPRSRVSFIHNGVDVERFASPDRNAAIEQLERRTGCSLRDGLRFVFVGYEFGRKRLDVAIRAMAGLLGSTSHLIVAGGADPASYQSLARELGVSSRVHFLGHVSDVEQVLAACDVFVFPTRYEAASLAILEALAAGLAIVTTDTAMAHEVLVHDQSALLIGNSDDASEATAQLQRLESEAGLLERLKANARAQAREHSWDSVWDRYDALYQRVLQDKAQLRRTR